ncbi:MAG: hypothetical protein CVU50_08415 [Candidatus Cloacimonetes bacterium HGW-Cloacimonetes-3]|jgi:hypothetical protein|nr:MAG: hypothetical protein CVU50_08415 [Candidatus Cloacimonetes bacterium HGW-Cloacimonetes-3]
MWGKLFWRVLSISDVLLILLILMCIAFSAFHFSNNKKDKTVFVSKNNYLQGEYPINIDAIIVIDEHNAIEIKDEKVRMIKADCPDKRCVKQGFSNSLPIICLPNQILIEIKENEADKMLILQ